MPYLEALNFHLVGYGCTTCIGNSGPLPEAVAEAVQKENLVVAAVLSGNRNFEGRINPLVKANYLASPPLVVAYALAGTRGYRPQQRTARHGLGRASRSTCATSGRPPEEVHETVQRCVQRGHVRAASTRDVFEGDENWQTMPVPDRRDVRVGREVHLHQEAAVFRPHGGSGDVDPGSARDARAGAARRFRDDRSHFAGRVDSEVTVRPAST